MKNNQLERRLRAHHADAFRWASQCCLGNYHDAEEVLQMTYLKIADGKARYHEKASFKTWLFAVIRHTAIDYLRKQVKHVELSSAAMLTSPPPPEENHNYRALLAQLPERQRQVLLLAFYHNLSLTEIAAVTDLHVGTVRTHYSRGKQALRKLLAKERV
ncbi:MAG: RNA polymerase sigma factor [Bacteroidota bacterium]